MSILWTTFGNSSTTPYCFLKGCFIHSFNSYLSKNCLLYFLFLLWCRLLGFLFQYCFLFFNHINDFITSNFLLKLVVVSRNVVTSSTKSSSLTFCSPRISTTFLLSCSENCFASAAFISGSSIPAIYLPGRALTVLPVVLTVGSSSSVGSYTSATSTIHL